jgi:hypothetical protein
LNVGGFLYILFAHGGIAIPSTLESALTFSDVRGTLSPASVTATVGDSTITFLATGTYLVLVNVVLKNNTGSAQTIQVWGQGSGFNPLPNSANGYISMACEYANTNTEVTLPSSQILTVTAGSANLNFLVVAPPGGSYDVYMQSAVSILKIA